MTIGIKEAIFMGAPLHSGDALLDQQARYGHWLLRTPLALVMLYHGIEKWLVSGISVFAESMGFSLTLAGMAAGIELAAGVALLLGALLGGWITRAGAALACVILIGAIFTLHWGQWHFLPSATHPLGGLEFQVTLLCLAIYLLVRGNEV
jgi:putative oxidoreductase